MEIPKLEKSALQALMRYFWPGNVRQLENEVKKLVALCEEGKITRDDLSPEIIDTQKETFDKNIRVDLQNKIAEIRKINDMISRDNQLIELREKITKSSSSQLDNGIITSTEYLTELNAESKAKLDLQSHKIQLIKARLDYKATLGNL